MQKIRKNKNKYCVNIIGVVLLSIILMGKTSAKTFGFNDIEDSIISLNTGTLDLNTYSDEGHFSANYDEMFKEDTVSRNIFVENTGGLPFKYKQYYDFNSGDTDFCSALILTVSYKYYDTDGNLQTEKKYDGPLNSYSENFDGHDSLMMISNSIEYYSNDDYDENEHWYSFELTLPEDADYDVSSKTCDFNIKTIAWQTDFSNEESGFWDESELHNSVSTGDWNPPEPSEITIYNHDDKNLFCNGLTNNEAITIDWNDSNAFDFDYYHLERFEEITVAYPTVSEYSMDLPEDGEYMFRVRTYDLGGNVSEWTEWCTVLLDTSIPDYDEGDVVINEIMWGGTSEHELDTYVELYNNTDETIDLTGWKLYGSAESFHPIELAGDVEAHGYFLITHFPTDHEQLNEKAAILDDLGQDQVDKEMHLRKQGEKLILKDVLGYLIDETPDAGPGDDNWESGEASPHGPWRSMERDDDGEGWHSSCENEIYWDDSCGSDYGTPRGENSPDNCEIVLDEELVEGADT